MQHWELLIYFLVIAFVYSSVGFGGGSSYLAILTLYAFPFKEMRLIALVCNIIVVSNGVFIYSKKGHINWRKMLPLVLPGVPMAYLGAIVRISEKTFFMVLGCCLIIAAVLLWLKTDRVVTTRANTNSSDNWLKTGALGGSIGFLSGMVGIGGGIFLSPILNLMKWDIPQKIAAAASFFILVNSVAGIAGQVTNLPGDINLLRIVLLSLAVFTGGQIGSRLTTKFNPVTIRRITAVLVFCAGTEVLFKHL